MKRIPPLPDRRTALRVGGAGLFGLSLPQFLHAEGKRTDREYYDLAADPWQLTNLLGDATPSNDPPVSALADSLAAQRRCAGAGCF